MENTKLLQVLKTFDKSETREMKKFLQSPFYNHRQDVLDLFLLLSRLLQKNKPLPSKKNIYALLYGEKKKYDDHALRMVISFLFKLIENYLAHKKIFADQAHIKTVLAEIYRKRNLPKHFQQSLRDAENFSKKQTLRSSRYFETLLKIEEERYQFYALAKRTREMNLQSVSDISDVLYFTSKLKHACQLLTHQNMFKTEYNLGLLPEILSYIETNNLLANPTVAAYYHGYQLLRQEEAPDSLRSLLDLLLQHDGVFAREEERGLYLLAINYCIRRINRGDKEILTASFALYREGLERGYLLTDQKLLHFTYRNIVTLGLIFKEYDWLEKFIFTYKDYLEEAFREPTFCFSLARLKYARNDNDAALALLQKADFSEALPSLSARMLILKIFYEADNFSVLTAHIAAMRTFIQRKKSLGYHRENYLNTLRLVKRRIEIPAFEKEKLQKWQAEVHSLDALAEKEWLLSL